MDVPILEARRENKLESCNELYICSFSESQRVQAFKFVSSDLPTWQNKCCRTWGSHPFQENFWGFLQITTKPDFTIIHETDLLDYSWPSIISLINEGLCHITKNSSAPLPV